METESDITYLEVDQTRYRKIGQTWQIEMTSYQGHWMKATSRIHHLCDEVIRLREALAADGISIET